MDIYCYCYYIKIEILIFVKLAETNLLLIFLFRYFLIFDTLNNIKNIRYLFSSVLSEPNNQIVNLFLLYNKSKKR